MPKTRTKQAMPLNISLEEFSARLAEKNCELLRGFLVGLQNGELSLEIDGGDNFIHAIIDEWCETEEPNRELHLRMISAIYIWLIMDEMNAEEIESSSSQSDAQDVRAQVLKGIQLTAEVIGTVRSIWRIANGKKA